MSKRFLQIFFISLILLVVYGFYEKDRRKNLLIDFRANKEIQCKDEIIKKEKGWYIHNNRFFTNKKNIYTIIFCKSLDND